MKWTALTERSIESTRLDSAPAMSPSYTGVLIELDLIEYVLDS